MKATNMKKAISKTQLLPMVVVALLLAATTAFAAAPGIGTTGASVTYNLTAQQAYLTQPDGRTLFSVGYGCASGATTLDFFPATITTASCNTIQVPGPNL